MFARLFEQRDDAVNFARRVFVGVGGAFRVVENGVDQNRDGLLRAVESQQLVGDEKIHHRRFQFILRRARHDGFDVVNEFVADEADRAAGEARQARHGHGAEFFHHALDHFEAVLHVAPDHEAFRDAAVFEHLDVLAVLPDDRARIAADERVAPDMFAAFDGFEEEGFALRRGFCGRRRAVFPNRPKCGARRESGFPASRVSEIHRAVGEYMRHF